MIGDIAELIAMISILAIPLGFVWLIYNAFVGRTKIKKNINRITDNLVASGFNITHSMGSAPDVVFDHPNRKLAFIGVDVPHRVFDYNDVRSWQYEWVDRQTQFGLRRWANTIMFNLNNIDTPVINVGFAGNAALAEQWNQRLDVMLNAQNA